MCEIWKDIVGYEGLYQISNLGRVKSYLKSSKYPVEQEHILTAHKSRGYINVLLSKNGKSRPFSVHRLVAQAFIPNPNNLPEVNHKDEDKTNNNVDNLEWCNRSYNMAYGNARIKQGISRGRPIEQLTVSNIPIARYSSAEIASKMTGIDASSIHKCCKHKRDYAGGYSWRYIKSFN